MRDTRLMDTKNAAPAQILLRWATQQGIAVIPKSTELERLAENLQCDNFTIPDAEIAKLDDLNINLRVRIRIYQKGQTVTDYGV